MCHLTWQDPVWDSLSYRKHVKSNKKNWDRSVTTAVPGMKGEASQYSPYLTADEIETMELACVERGTQIQDKCHKRTFFLDLERIIGASDGEQTSWIYVEYHNSGSVHGRPMTRGQIQDKLDRAKK